jgi:hypothetical protein
MGEEVPKDKLPLEEKLSEFFQEVPSIFTSLQNGIQSTKLRFYYFSSRQAAKKEISIQYYPFQTIQDIRSKVATALGKELGKTIDPLHVCLLASITGIEEEQSTGYVPFTHYWRNPYKTDKKEKSDQEDESVTEQEVINPFDQIKGSPNSIFVNVRSGEPTTIQSEDQSRMMVEDMIYYRLANSINSIHVFLFSDLVAAFPREIVNPLSRADQWYGKIYPYFNNLSFDKKGEISPKQKERSENYLKYITYADSLIQEYEKVLRKYDEQIGKQDTDKYRVHFGGVKYLKLIWQDVEKSKAKDVELLFYETPVTKQVPFIRLLQPDREAISKILIKPDSLIRKEPDISPPRLFLDWASEDSATPEADYLYMKTIYHESSIDEPINMYGTLRVTADKKAAYILMPPKQKRYLELRRHLSDFPRLLQTALAKTPYAAITPRIHKMAVLCGIRLLIQDKPLTLEVLRARVEAMSYVFQEIKPLPGSNALITLRFKLVSNFQTDDRIHQFIKQLEERYEIRGDSENDMEQMIDYITREFGISRSEAMERIKKFYQEKIELVPVDIDAKDFIAKYDYGVDVVVRGSHPQYIFDIYGLKSQSTFQRLLTCLTMLFASRNKDWLASRSIYSSYNKAAIAVGKATAGDTKVQEEEEEDLMTLLARRQKPKDEKAKKETLLFDDDDDLFLNNDSGDTEQEERAQATTEQQEAPAPPPKVVEEEEKKEEQEESEGNVELEVEGPGGKKGLKAQQAKKKGAEKEKPLAGYFLNRLKAADETLFTTDKEYASLCQANYMNQPLVLNEAQYEVMLNKQAKNKHRFVRYGVDPKTRQPFKESPPREGSYVTVMAYGSSPNNINYYLCPQYYCYKDEVVLFQEDMDSLEDINKRPKIKNSCPFCGGVEIPKNHRTDPQTVRIDGKVYEETIFNKRIFQTPAKKIHDEIGFLTKKELLHPSRKFWIPCCFLTPDPKKERGKDIQPTGSAAAAYTHLLGEGPKPAAPPVKTQPFLSYRIVLDKPETRYIQGAAKFPLDVFSSEGPQIGLLLPGLDEYFTQNPNYMVARDFTKSKLQPNGEGFLRLAVQNGRQHLNDSFLSALAPYLNLNNIKEVKEKLINEIKPPIFANLNYGNLMNEFYRSDAKIPENVDMGQWTKKWFPNVSYTTETKYYIERIYKSWHQFQAYINLETELKQYRHFAQLLSSPLPLTNDRGILFLVLEYNPDDTVSVNCPPFGYDEDKHKNCDYGILLKHYSGHWEPIFYVKNLATTTTQQGLSRSDLIFQSADENSTDPQFIWPDILRKRIQEFRRNCISSMKTSLFTLQSGINPAALLTVTGAVDGLTNQRVLFKNVTPIFNGFVKDIYNHIVGITIKIYKEDRYAIIPVVDDGKVTYFNMTMYFDWDQVPVAPADMIYEFYETVVKQQLPAFEGYHIKAKIVSVMDDNQIMALQLQNGIYIPTNKTPQAKLANVPTVTVDDYKSFRKNLDYHINISIFEENKAIRKEREITMEQNDLEEIYQHFRLTFSNWMTSKNPDRRADPSIISKINDTIYRRKGVLNLVEDTIFNRNLPLFEKRQRLYLTFGTEISKWLYLEDYQRKPINSLLRVDCRIQDTKETCDNAARCKWRAADSKCLLHAPRVGRVGGQENVDIVTLFVYRLIDELIRFPEKRKQLMKTGVHSIVHLTDAVLLGETQYVVPENTLAWQDLWRMEWVPKEKEEPRYYEEMSVPPKEDQFTLTDEPLPKEKPAKVAPKIVLGKDLREKLKALRIAAKGTDEEEKKDEGGIPQVEKPPETQVAEFRPIREERKTKLVKDKPKISAKFLAEYKKKQEEVAGPATILRNLQTKVNLPEETKEEPPKPVVVVEEPPKPVVTVEEPPKPVVVVEEPPKPVVTVEEAPESSPNDLSLNENEEASPNEEETTAPAPVVVEEQQTNTKDNDDEESVASGYETEEELL